MKVHLNGRLVDADQATVSISDAGFLHGASTFTTMYARGGVVFRLDRHLSRLMDTATKMQLRMDVTAGSLAGAVAELLAANGLPEARVRITLTPGSVRGSDGPPATLITAEPVPEYPREWYEQGITVVVSTFRQARSDPTFGYKTGCYFPRIFAMQAAAIHGASESLWYTTDNTLAEACFCSVFLVQEGTVRTPPLDTPVLPGIVREATLELCDRLEIPRDDRTPLTVHDMLAAEEMFLTASVSGIRPVAHVEKHTVGEGRPGEITRKIMSAYRELLDTECSPRYPGSES